MRLHTHLNDPTNNLSEEEATFMRKVALRKRNTRQIWFASFPLLIFGVGCGSSDKNGTNPGTTSPTVLSAVPPNATNGACPNSLVTVTFSKAMKASTINGTTLTLTGPGSAAVAGEVTYDASSHTATFTPSATLALNTVYTGTTTSGAQDTFGNALANQVWTFTTGATTCQPGPPSVISTAPVDRTVGLCPNAIAVATFGEAMNPATLNTTTFTLSGPGAALVAGQVSYEPPAGLRCLRRPRRSR